MCGITGIVTFNNGTLRANLPSYLAKMNQSLRHRGPDDEGFAFFDDKGHYFPCFGMDTPAIVKANETPYQPTVAPDSHLLDHVVIGLGHRRLSIIDLSPAGHQPMCDRSRNYWMTFNGEIYNYLELRAELETLGCTFYTSSDSEVLLQAWITWGEGALQRLNGMWAFCVFDVQAGRLYLARDVTGVKPLYYHHDHEFFAFASEQKALLSLPEIPLKLNHKAAYDYFVMGKIEHEEEGLFAGIMELMPGEICSINLNTGSISTYPYKVVPQSDKKFIYSDNAFSDAVEQTRALLLNSIKLRLRADVTVGSCLSGGLDSSSIVTGMHQLLPQGQQLSVFTAAFDNPMFDERPWAKHVVDQTSSDWHVTSPTADELAQNLGTMLYAQDIPTFSSRTYAQFRVMEMAAKQGVKVLLDGQGGDELFSGYNHHNLSFWFELLQSGQFKKLIHEMQLSGGVGQGAKSLLKAIVKMNWIPKLPANAVAWLYAQQKSEMHFLDADFLQEHRQRLHLLRQDSLTDLNGSLEHEYFGTPLKHLLRCEDRSSMWYSIESRTPFADDKELYNYVFSLPASFKMKDGQRKVLLREAMKGILPEPVRTRQDKMGFDVPNNEWIKHMAKVAIPMFMDDTSGIFNKKALEEGLNAFLNPKSPVEDFKVFKYIAFVYWWQEFNHRLT
jgi:asparagine synthase (glutamine-hydrolysing)